MSLHRTLLPLTAAVAAGVLLSGCSFEMKVGNDPTPPYNPETDSSQYTEDYANPEPFGGDNADLYTTRHTLNDGRKVAMWYSEGGTELMEQHYSPDADGWTAPQAIYTSDEPDPCQGIDIVDEDGIVAVIADFGGFCYDGEPPMESLAIVGTGDLTEWQVDMTPGFDGWEQVTLTDGKAEWKRGDKVLTWSEGDFSG